MSSAIFLEELLQPETTLPEQFEEIWHRGSTPTPERALALSVLWQAAADLQKFRRARTRKQQRLYMEAYQWVASEERTWPYSFVNLCEVLRLSPDFLRAELLGPSAGRDLVLHPPPAVDEAA
jgi:hypothetical protein